MPMKNDIDFRDEASWVIGQEAAYQEELEGTRSGKLDDYARLRNLTQCVDCMDWGKIGQDVFIDLDDNLYHCRDCIAQRNKCAECDKSVNHPRHLIGEGRWLCDTCYQNFLIEDTPDEEAAEDVVIEHRTVISYTHEALFECYRCHNKWAEEIDTFYHDGTGFVCEDCKRPDEVEAEWRAREAAAIPHLQKQTDMLKSLLEAVTHTQQSVTLTRSDVVLLLSALSHEIQHVDEKSINPSQRQMQAARIALRERLKRFSSYGTPLYPHFSTDEWEYIRGAVTNHVDWMKDASEHYTDEEIKAHQGIIDAIDSFLAID